MNDQGQTKGVHATVMGVSGHNERVVGEMTGFSLLVTNGCRECGDENWAMLRDEKMNAMRDD